MTGHPVVISLIVYNYRLNEMNHRIDCFNRAIVITVSFCHSTGNEIRVLEDESSIELESKLNSKGVEMLNKGI